MDNIDFIFTLVISIWAFVIGNVFSLRKSESQMFLEFVYLASIGEDGPFRDDNLRVW